MGNKLNFDLDGAVVEFEVSRVLVAGYTGRNTEQVRAHITELERQGIPAPPRVPMMYSIDPSWATTSSELTARASVSGEAEPALIFRGNDLDDALVSVIVDFTDRDTERESIAVSKELPKPLSRRVWRYRDLEDSWDEIALRSWVEPGSDHQFYQSGTLAQLLAPRDLLRRLNPEGALKGTVLLMGTLPLLSHGFLFAEYFGCELERKDGSKLSYECRLRRPEAK